MQIVAKLYKPIFKKKYFFGFSLYIRWYPILLHSKLHTRKRHETKGAELTSLKQKSRTTLIIKYSSASELRLTDAHEL